MYYKSCIYTLEQPNENFTSPFTVYYDDFLHNFEIEVVMKLSWNRKILKQIFQRGEWIAL